MTLCAKAGCASLATHHVILDAADGSDDWWACRDHALEFRSWVINETNRQGENWASVVIEEFPDIEWVPGSAQQSE